MRKTLMRAVGLAWLLLGTALVRAEDGYDLWLRYRPLPAAQQRELRSALVNVVGIDAQASPMLRAAVAEIERGIEGLAAYRPRRGGALVRGSLLFATPSTQPRLDLPWSRLGSEGYLLRSLTLRGQPVTVIAANGEPGLLYGSFALLAHLQTGGRLT